jgi:hypothetical protein
MENVREKDLFDMSYSMTKPGVQIYVPYRYVEQSLLQFLKTLKIEIYPIMVTFKYTGMSSSSLYTVLYVVHPKSN